MHLLVFLQGLGSISFFASRAFLPAFVTSILIRFGPQIPWLGKLGVLGGLPTRGVPGWFTSDVAIIAMGALAVLEFGAQRSLMLRDLMKSSEGILRAAMAAMTYLAIANSSEVDEAAKIFKQAGMLGSLPALFIAGGTYAAASLGRSLVRPIAEADEDDHLGLQRLARWASEAWGVVGPVALIVFPLLTIASLALALVAVAMVERRVSRMGDSSVVRCPNCEGQIHACASFCPHCQAANPSPMSVDLLGRPGTRPAREKDHAFRLVAVKRCPVCAARFSRREARQECPACAHLLMGDPEFARNYVAWLDRRVPWVLLVCLGLGFVPVVGVFPGVICYRLAVVAPLSRYVPLTDGFLIGWGVRAASVFLVGLQWIPFAGALALPSMAILNYLANKKAYGRLVFS